MKSLPPDTQPATLTPPNTAQSPAPNRQPVKTPEPTRAQADQQLTQLLTTDLSKRKIW